MVPSSPRSSGSSSSDASNDARPASRSGWKARVQSIARLVLLDVCGSPPLMLAALVGTMIFLVVTPVDQRMVGPDRPFFHPRCRPVPTAVAEVA